MSPLGFSACHLQTEMVFLLLSNLDAFYFLSLMMALAGTSGAVWSSGGRRDPCLVPDLGGTAFSLSTFVNWNASVSRTIPSPPIALCHYSL